MDYIITADGFVSQELYLAHHGVQGMKWGVRRYQPYGSGYSGSKGKFVGTAKQEKKIAKREGKIRRLEERMDSNALQAESIRKSINAQTKNEKRRERKKDAVTATEKFVNDKNEFNRQRQIAKVEKIKGNKNYKKSADYQNAKLKADRTISARVFLGPRGSAKIETLKREKNYSGYKAAGRVAVEKYGKIALASLIGGAIGVAVTKNKKDFSRFSNFAARDLLSSAAYTGVATGVASGFVNSIYSNRRGTRARITRRKQK